MGIQSIRIIEPLTSRCAKFRFKPLPIEKLQERIAMVCEQEGVQIEPEVRKKALEELLPFRHTQYALSILLFFF